MNPKSVVRLALANAVLVCSALAAEPSAAPSASSGAPSTPLGNATLAPGLKAAADRDHVNLLGVAKGDIRTPTEGDAMVLWVGTSDGTSTKQWLVQLRRSLPTSKEIRAGTGRPKSKYLSWGPVITFQTHTEALDVWIAGPAIIAPLSNASANVPLPVKRLRVRVPGDYLRLGLDNSARVDLRIRQLATIAEREKHPINFGHIYALDKPVKPANVAGAKPVAEQLGFTPEAARAWIGGHIALQAFYDLVNDVPELHDIAAVAMERPPVWKLAKLATGTVFQGGLGGPETRPVDPAALGLMPVALEAFAVPFGLSFGKDPVVGGEMVVVSPIPPLDVTAGILGVIAVHPKNPRRIVHVVVVGADSAAPSIPSPHSKAQAQLGH